MSTPTQQADNLYLRTREALLPFEDSILNALQQGTANYYTPRNDQSIWGEIQRAVAIELAKMDYYYAYDQVNKNPQFLTPPDIRRRWANPLFISNLYPQATQSDLAYRTMLVELIAAYQMGATVKALEAIIFAYTGLTVTVIELYKLIGQGFYDQSDRNAISVSINVGGNNPFEDVTNLNQLQAIIQTLYGALDLGKPANVGLELAAVFGSDENIDLFVTSTDTIVGDEPHVIAAVPSLYGIGSYGYGVYGATNYPITLLNSPFDLDFGVTLEDTPPAWNPLTNYVTSPPQIFTVSYLGRNYANYDYTHNVITSPPIGTFPTVRTYWTDVTVFGRVASGIAPGPFQYSVVVNSGVATYFFNAANVGQTVSIGYSYATNPSGIRDQLRIFVELVEAEPYPLQLFLAPDLIPTTPATGLAPVNGWPTNSVWDFGQSYSAATLSPPYSGASILDPNGFVQLVTTSGTTYPYWQVNFTYTVGTKIRDLNNNIQTVTSITTGISGGTVPPFSQTLGGRTIDGGVTWTMTGIFTFNQILNQTTTDGTVVWTNMGRPPGVLAPRIVEAWEISGGDTFNGFLLV
jgi:hypothetical protein